MGNTTIHEGDVLTSLDTVRNRTWRLLKSALGQIGKFNRSTDISTLRVLKEELEDKWSDYMRAFEQQETALASLSSVDLATISQEFIESHNKYVQSKVILAQLMAPHLQSEPLPRAESSPSQSAITTNFKMPPVRITPFDGNVCNWIEFKATCDSVLRDTIPDVQRLQYLKDALIGEPRAIVSHILPTEGAYQRAMDVLKTRYENTRAIINENLRQFYAIPSILTPNASVFRSMLNTVNGLVSALASCAIDTSSWNSIIIFHCSQRFDKTTLAVWEERLEGQRSVPTLRKFLEFLETRITVCETTDTFIIDRPADCTVKPAPKYQPNPKFVADQKKGAERFKSFYTIRADYKCLFCGKNHLHSRCDALERMPPKDRNAIVRRNNLCANCFYAHDVTECPFMPACKKCSMAHNTLLHLEEQQVFLNQTELEPVTDSIITQLDNTLCDPQEEFLNQITGEHFFHVQEADCVRGLLATALVPTRSNGHSILCKTLVDGGSTGSLITVNACRLLQIRYPRFKTPMTGVGGSPVGNVVGRALIEIGSIYNKNYSFRFYALVVRSIGDVSGIEKSNQTEWPHLNGLQLADPTYQEPGPIDLLLGTIPHADVLLDGLHKGNRGDPIAQRTELGWLVSGPMRVSKELNANCNHVTLSKHIGDTDDSGLCQQLKQFWEIEEVMPRRLLTSEESMAEEIFAQSICRSDDGKFIVDLPFKQGSQDTLGESRASAERRYKSLQRRFDRDPQLKHSYDAVFEEYLQFKHMELVKDNPQQQVFIPHHPVIKETSTTTKVRNVFDASMKTSTGVSLNQCLCVGPTIQPELLEQLIQWRKFEFAVSGDIEKMYRQVWINPAQANFQSILWKRPGDESIATYRLLTVTFGTSSAPFQAVRSLYEAGERVKSIDPDIAGSIQRNFYIDDFLKSYSSIESAVSARQRITDTLAEYGFHLRKWKSNDNRILAGLDAAECDAVLDFNSTFKTLGIAWKSQTDEFVFNSVTNDIPEIWTKRNVLSVIAKLFDPLGWLAPFVVKAKLFMQDIWRLPNTKAWDDALPNASMAQWKEIFEELNAPVPITIQRWLRVSDNNERIEIHTFSDASNVAYAGCVYLRVVHHNGMIDCNLIAAKTRVAPIKIMTVPRLELCGALLAAKLSVRCIKALEIGNARIFAWSDSKIVLAWLATHPSKWVTFVANRVSDIQELIDARHWMHIPSKQNPADIASRGMSMKELSTCDLWWHGPSFLRSTNEPSPKQNFNLSIDYAPDKRKGVKVFHVDAPKSNYVLVWFSEYVRMIRFTCHAMRWLAKIHRQNPRVTRSMSRIKAMPITACEIDDAEQKWIKCVQQESFGHEIGRLREKRPLPSQSKLMTLSPFIDDNGVLRMNGRVGNAELMQQKQSIILPANSPFVSLMIKHFHENLELHGGVQKTLRALRERFWIIRARCQVQKLIHRCITCYRTKKLLLTQRMAELPSFRTRQARPFTFVGIDYAGYFEVKITERKNSSTTKAYIAVFMCLTTKALHLEVASDLTSAEYIMVLENFIARRGIPNVIWSDNATNFVGAEKEIRELHEQWMSQTNELTKLLAEKRITFKHIPARASHMAGIWERAVAQVKYHLKRVLKDVKLTVRRFDHTVKQIECCLNSRPLWALTPNADDIEVITPSHFFNFEPINSLPRPNLEHIPMSRLDQYQYLHHLYTEFWKGWSREYLSTLQPRKKWSQERPNVRVGQVVVVSEDNLPPSRWPIGKITAVHSGKDNLVRVVEVLCRGKVLQRPIHRLGILPILDNEELNNSGMEQLNAGENVAPFTL